VFVFLLAGCTAQTYHDESSNESVDTDRIVITLAYGKERTYPGDVIEAFNQSQDTYFIQGICYGNGSDSARREKLMQDLQTGNAPDIVLTGNFALDCQGDDQLYFENLRPYIDTSETLDWSDFVSAFMDAYAPDGSLYNTVSAFAVETVVMRQSDETPLSIDSIVQLVQTCGGVENMQYWDSNFYGILLDQAIARCVNYDDRSCDFSTSEFYQALKLYTEYYSLDNSEEQIHPEGLLYVDAISSFSSVQFHEAIFQSKVAYVGYPLINEPLFSVVGDCYAINADSTQKDGAWLFLEYLLSEEYQFENCAAFPTNIHALERRIENAKEGAMEETSAPFAFDMNYVAASEDEIEQILALIDITKDMNWTTEDEWDVSVIVLRIIEESCAADNRSIDDMILLIQQAVEEYFSNG
jgi:ABC-type glycerol-3-phosphate transport system substrate-binding protein